MISIWEIVIVLGLTTILRRKNEIYIFIPNSDLASLPIADSTKSKVNLEI